MLDTIKKYTPNYISEFGHDKNITHTGIELFNEELVEFENRPVMGEFDYVDFIGIPEWKDVKDKTPFTPKHKQAWGQCDRYATNYMQREAMILSGIKVNREFVIDVDFDYVNRYWLNHKDSGTIVSKSYEEFVEKGKPIAFREQSSSKNKMGNSYLDFKNNINLDVVGLSVIYPFYKNILNGRNAKELFGEIRKLQEQKKKFVFRFSIINDNGVAVYHREVPKIIGKVDLRGGAHSLAGIGSTGVFDFHGIPTIQSFESTGSVFTHKWELPVAERSIYAWEIYEVVKPTIKKNLIVEDKKENKVVSKFVRTAKRCFKGLVCRNDKKQVIAIQKRLGLLQDGDFGINTYKSVVVFQKKNGLVIDGKVGSKTWKTMFN